MSNNKIDDLSIVLLDIETSPIISYNWETYQSNALKVIEPSKLISCAWKQLYEEETHVRALPDYSNYKPGKLDDSKLIKDIWKVLDEADVIIGHHSDSFDLKKLNARFVINGLDAPSTYETVDTLKVAKKYFKFDSNNLNALGSYLNVGSKLNNGGFDLWVRCIAGDKEAWELMKKYNIQDVVLLEQIYLRLRSFNEDHPNLNIIAGAEGTSCPSCLSESLTKRGFSITKTGRKQRYQCEDCGSWSSGPYERVKNVLQ